MGALAGFLLKWLLDPRVLGALAVAVVIWLGWSHYTGLRDDLDAARTELAASKVALDQAVTLAENNAAQLEKATEQHKAALTAMEEAFADLTTILDEAQQEDAKILSAPAEDNGPVPPVLGDFLLRRFGGE
jgi:uncharacterized protein HemX